jgi:hypothetical protein
MTTIPKGISCCEQYMKPRLASNEMSDNFITRHYSPVLCSARVHQETIQTALSSPSTMGDRKLERVNRDSTDIRTPDTHRLCRARSARAVANTDTNLVNSEAGDGNDNTRQWQQSAMANEGDAHCLQRPSSRIPARGSVILAQHRSSARRPRQRSHDQRLDRPLAPVHAGGHGLFGVGHAILEGRTSARSTPEASRTSTPLLRRAPIALRLHHWRSPNKPPVRKCFCGVPCRVVFQSCAGCSERPTSYASRAPSRSPAASSRREIAAQAPA